MASLPLRRVLDGQALERPSGLTMVIDHGSLTGE